MITLKQLNIWFKGLHLNGEAEEIAKIEAAGLRFAVEIVKNTQPSADQSAAIRKVREAVLTACDAVRVHHVKEVQQIDKAT